MGFFANLFSASASTLSIRKSISKKHSRQMDKDDIKMGSCEKKSIPREVQELDQDHNGTIGHEELRAYMDKHTSLWAMLSSHCKISEKECREIACETAYQMAKLPAIGPDAGFEDLKGTDLAREPTIEEFSAFHLKLEQDPAYDLQFFHRTVFHTFDNDNDGYIKEEEIGDFVKLFYDVHSMYSNDVKVELPPKNELQARMFYHFDTNHDGRLDFHEFEPIVSGGTRMLSEVLDDKEAKRVFMEKRKQEQTFHKEYREEQERQFRMYKLERERSQTKDVGGEGVRSPGTLNETYTDFSEELPPPPPADETPSTKAQRRSSTMSTSHTNIDDAIKSPKAHRKSPKKSKHKKASGTKAIDDTTKEEESRKSQSSKSRGRSSSLKEDKGLRSSSKTTQRQSVSRKGLRSSGSSSSGKRRSKGKDSNDNGLQASTKGTSDYSGLQNSMTSGKSVGQDHGLRGSTKGTRDDSGLQNSMISGRSPRTKLRKSLNEEKNP